ncbi:MAG: hypothetical protein AAF389_10640 [Gemmatimonadota bacterium]
MNRTALAAALALALVACGDTGVPLESIRVTGTVTANGVPAAAGQASLIDGFGLSVTTDDISNGEFTLEGEIVPESCTPTAVSVIARDGDGNLVGLATEELSGCGDHVVNFTF